MPGSAPPAFHLLAKRNGRYADEVTGLLALEDGARYANVGRNDTCPCGSGRKFQRLSRRRHSGQTIGCRIDGALRTQRHD